MAQSSNMFMMMIIFIVGGALLVIPGTLGDISETPTPLPQLAPEESPGLYKHLKRCSERFYTGCGPKIYFAIYFGNTTLAYDCCENLVYELGKVCHEDLMRFTLKSQTFKDSASQIVARAAQTWNKCVEIAE